jgi:hypothetical protein
MSMTNTKPGENKQAARKAATKLGPGQSDHPQDAQAEPCAHVQQEEADGEQARQDGVMGHTWTWEKGGTATLLETDGNFVRLLSSRSAPPGAPLTALSETNGRFQLKVRGCRRSAEHPDRFIIDGRFFNLTKEQRATLITPA